MIIQKIGNAPNFSAKTKLFAEYAEGERDLTTDARQLLAKEPKLEAGLFFGIFRKAAPFMSDESYETLSLAICDSKGECVTDGRIIYNHDRYSSRGNIPMKSLLEIKQIAQQLRAELASKIQTADDVLRGRTDVVAGDILSKLKKALDTIQKQAYALGYDLAKKV